MGGVSPDSGSGSGMLMRAQEEMRLPAPGNARGGADSIYRQHVCVASLCLLTNESSGYTADTCCPLAPGEAQMLGVNPVRVI